MHNTTRKEDGFESEMIKVKTQHRSDDLERNQIPRGQEREFEVRNDVIAANPDVFISRFMLLFG